MRSSREHGRKARAGIPQRRRRARMGAGKRACHAHNRCWRTPQPWCGASGVGGLEGTGGHGVRALAPSRSSCNPGGDEGGRGEAVGRQRSTGSWGGTGGHGRRPLALARSSCTPGRDEGGRREAGGRQRPTGSEVGTGGHGRRSQTLARSSSSPKRDEGGRREAAGRRSTRPGMAEGAAVGFDTLGGRMERSRSSERGSKEVRSE